MANGNVGKGFADLGMRAALPVGGGFIGAIVGALTAPSNDGFRGIVRVWEGAALGLVVGVGSAIIIDAAVLARKDVTPGRDLQNPEPTPAPARQAAIRVLPSFSPTPGGATGGVVGTF